MENEIEDYSTLEEQANNFIKNCEEIKKELQNYTPLKPLTQAR